MRCTQSNMVNKTIVKFRDGSRQDLITGEFSMDEVMKLVECMPDEILPLYRRPRIYVNSVLSCNEIYRTSTNNKNCLKEYREVAIFSILF
ncbi:MAG: hypothetical protein ABI288_10555 [Ginsengibacter sp.]